MERILTVAVLPLVVAAVGLLIGALIGDHPGARHLRMRCRTLFGGLQLLLFLYGYIGLVAGRRHEVAWPYEDATSAMIVTRAVAGMVLFNLLGRLAFRSLVVGGVLRLGSSATYASLPLGERLADGRGPS